MRTISKVINLYKLEELSKEAQERAYNKFLENNYYIWSYDNRETLKEFERVFDVNVKSWEYDEYRYGFSLVFPNDDKRIELYGEKLSKLIMNCYWEHLFVGKVYYKNKRRRRSRILKTNDCVLTGYIGDYFILKPIYDFLRKPDKYTNFEDLMNDCVDSFFSYCQKDLEYYNSYANFEDVSKSNDLEYLEDGEIYR